MFHCPQMTDTASLIAPSNCRGRRNGLGRGRTRDSFAASCILKDHKQRGSPSNRTKNIAPDTSCPDICPTWPGFKPILSSHYPQTYKAGQVVQVEGLFTSSCRESMSSPSSLWICSHPELKQVCGMHAYGPAAHTAIIHMEQHTYFTAYCYWSYHNERLVLLLGPIKSTHQ